MSGSHIHGGMSATQLSIQEQERLRRAQRDAAATRYLTRLGAVDLLPVLGLAPEPCGNCGGPVVKPDASGGFCRRRECQALAGEVEPRRKRGGA